MTIEHMIAVRGFELRRVMAATGQTGIVIVFDPYPAQKLGEYVRVVLLDQTATDLSEQLGRMLAEPMPGPSSPEKLQ